MSSTSARSGSSRKLRDELNASQINNHVPVVESSVSITKYFKHSKHLYQFAVELGKHVAYHQPQHQAARAWQKKATDYAISMLEAVVARMDDIEDAKQRALEEELIDEFDGPVSSPAAGAPVTASAPTTPLTRLGPSNIPPDDALMKALSILRVDGTPAVALTSVQPIAPSAPLLQHAPPDVEDVSDDRRVLALTRAAVASGSVPRPHPHIQDLSLSFTAPSQCVIRYQKHDFFVSFESFMTYLPPDLQISRSVVETNRCFFIHLGVATGFHPYLLQGFFRWAAKRMLEEIDKDDVRAELLQSVMQYAGFVDANVLCLLWPAEFSEMRTRVCFLCGSVNRPMVVAFTPDDLQGSASGPFLDITLHCDGQHFVFLNPIAMHHDPGCMHVVGSGSGGSVDDLLRHARASGLVVQEHVVRPSSWGSAAASTSAVGGERSLGIRDFLAVVG